MEPKDIAEKDVHNARSLSQEFRDDVVRVARNREPGQELSVIAKDFEISESCLSNWMRRADVEDGNRPGKTREDRPSCGICVDGTGCWSRRTGSCAALPPTCPWRACREKVLPARE